MTSKEDVEVRLVDQEMINEFGRLNNRLIEVKAEIAQVEADAEKLDDASTELALSTDENAMVFIGDSFLECNQDFANEYCESKIKKIEEKKVVLKQEEDNILSRQKVLKAELYGRFGDSINLEN